MPDVAPYPWANLSNSSPIASIYISLRSGLPMSFRYLVMISLVIGCTTPLNNYFKSTSGAKVKLLYYNVSKSIASDMVILLLIK